MEWIKQKIPFYTVVFKRLLLALLMYQLIRFAFFLINKKYFGNIGLFDYPELVFQSLRFDLSITLTINVLFILMGIFLLPYVKSLFLKGFAHFVYVLTNAVCFIFDIADIGYFPYVRKRMNSDVFDLIGKKSDFIDLMPSYAQEFWYVFVLILVFVYLFHWIASRCIPLLKTSSPLRFGLPSLGFDILVLTLTFLGIRGGVQLKPLQAIDALAVVENTHVPLVVNSPFNILHSMELKRMVPVSFMTDEEFSSYYQPIKNYHKTGKGKPDNIVLIVLESFGKGYTGVGGRKSFTPFLDSLMQQGLSFSNAYANAFRSADGIPACVSGIPHFMDDALSYSPYASNDIDALPLLLKRMGYSSAFFHGGSNGTMNFDAFAKHAGFDFYFGRNEYDQDQDYDGTWGIWDEPFLQFAANRQSDLKPPFFSTIFTLSSHEPFGLPKSFKVDRIKKLKGIQRGIAYGDYALEQYFKLASTKDWYSNTLFVITADHNFLACVDSLDFYNQRLGLFSIPMLLYKPNSDFKLKGSNANLVQQIDILPTVLEYVNYPDSFFAYGKSMFDTTRPSFSFHLIDNYYYFRYQNRVVTAYGETIQSTFSFDKDSTLKNPLPQEDSLSKDAIQYYKAFRQLLYQTIPSNRMSHKTYGVNSNVQ